MQETRGSKMDIILMIIGIFLISSYLFPEVPTSLLVGIFLLALGACRFAGKC